MDPSGSVLQALAEDEVAGLVSRLAEHGVEALAISFLHADRNDAHERRAREILSRLWPAGSVVLGSEVCPFPDERLRTATAALAAYLTPLMTRYVAGLERVLAEAGMSPVFRFIESAGASLTPEDVRRSPLQTILSGPAGGAVAGAALSQLLRLSSAVTADMGGTSFDVAILQDGQPQLRADRTLEFGLRVAVPCVDIQTVGIGGGSLAWLDESVAGGLQVGPQSAGAFPGPACFGRGGRKPTVTDASLLLDRLVGDRTDLGLPPLDPTAAERAILAEVCSGFGMEPTDAADMVLEVAEARMAAFVRSQLTTRGISPTRATLIAFGGAGPVHAAPVAKRLGLKRVVVPYPAAGFSALGCLLCPPAQVALLAVDESLHALSPARLRELCVAAFGGDPGATAPRADPPTRRESARGPSAGPGRRRVSEARLRRYQSFVQHAYGIRPATETIRVVRLLAVWEQGSSAVAFGPALEATFRGRQDTGYLRHAARRPLLAERPWFRWSRSPSAAGDRPGARRPSRAPAPSCHPASRTTWIVGGTWSWRRRHDSRPALAPPRRAPWWPSGSSWRRPPRPWTLPFARRPCRRASAATATRRPASTRRRVRSFSVDGRVTRCSWKLPPSRSPSWSAATSSATAPMPPASLRI